MHPVGGDGRRSLFEVALLATLLIATAHVLWPALDGAFVYDDRILVAQNPTLRSLAGLSRAWTGAYWDFLELEVASQLGYWRPLTAVALHAGWKLGGGAAWGFHAVSLALHLVATAAAFHLARRLARSAAVGFWSALLFGLHPVQVEPVAWISSVNDPLYGAAVLLALLAFHAWRERGSSGIPLLPCALFTVGLLAKENAAAFVPLALALDLGRRPREVGADRPPGLAASLRPFWRAHGAFLAVALAYYLARVAVFGDPGAGVDRIVTVLAIEGTRRLTLRLELLGGFLGLLAWPAELNLFREIRPVLPPGDPAFLGACAWVAVWVAVTLWAVRKRARPLLVGLLVPVAGVLPALVRFESLGRFVLSERFLYVAVFGAAFLAALLWRSRLPRWLSCALLASATVAAGFRSRERTHDWRDEEALFRATVAASPRSPYALWGLGRVLTERFQATGDSKLLGEALESFQRVQDLVSPPAGATPDPTVFYTLDDVLQANCGVGWCYFFLALAGLEEATLDEARLVFSATLQRFPDAREALIGLGVVRMHQGELEQARVPLERAAELEPRLHPAWFNLGQLEVRSGDWAGAAQGFERALEILPGDPQTELWLGTALAEGDLDRPRARALLMRAREALRNDPAPCVQLGALDAREGRWREALTWFDEALRIEPSHSQAQLLRSKVLIQLGQQDRAVAALGEACRALPESFEAHYLLGRLLAERGFGEAARPYLERALALDPQGPYATEIRAALDALPPREDSPGESSDGR